MEFMAFLVFLFIFMGLAFLLAGVITMLVYQKGNRTGQDTEATVVSTRKETYGSGTRRGTRYLATMTYSIEGQTYTVETGTTSLGPLEEGKTIIVGIDPEKPKKVWLRRDKGSYVACYKVGGVLTALGIVLYLIQLLRYSYILPF